RIDPDRDPAFIVIISEERFDLVFRDVEAGDIRQCSLQAVSDLDVHFAILNEYEPNHAVVATLLPNFRVIFYTISIVFNRRVDLNRLINEIPYLFSSFVFILCMMIYEE